DCTNAAQITFAFLAVLRHRRFGPCRNPIHSRQFGNRGSVEFACGPIQRMSRRRRHWLNEDEILAAASALELPDVVSGQSADGFDYRWRRDRLSQRWERFPQPIHHGLSRGEQGKARHGRNRGRRNERLLNRSGTESVQEYGTTEYSRRDR